MAAPTATVIEMTPASEEYKAVESPNRSATTEEATESTSKLEITEEDKSGVIFKDFLRLDKVYIRGLHLSWIMFFVAFIAWFAVAPLNSVIKKTLHLKKKQILYANFASVTTTIVARLGVGPLTDKYGPKTAGAILLLLGAIPVFCVSQIKNWHDLVAVRAAIGILGATFVPCQAWTTLMFKKSVVGTANAIVGGWGNLGGGVTQFLMVDTYEHFRNQGMNMEQAWRHSFVVPGCMVLAAAFLIYFCGTDTPKGDIRDLKKRGYVPRKAASSMRDAMREPATWLLMLQYAMSFGVELVVFNMAEMYFHETFKVSVVRAGHVASLGGMGNLVTRAAGGLLSDWVNNRFDGMKSRLAVQAMLLLAEGSLLLAFSHATTYSSACILLLSFSVFVQMANGSCFGIVPYVTSKSMGSVSGLVGAGGNVGAMVFSLAFIYGKFPDIAYGFRMMGYTVLCVACTTWMIRPREADFSFKKPTKPGKAIDSTVHSEDVEAQA